MKTQRRRAVHAELVRESKDNPGYFRYNVTIKELDGTCHVVPAYGKDMQDAIERLVWKERIDKISNKRITIISNVVFLLGVIAAAGSIAVTHNEPFWIAVGMGVIAGAVVVTSGISKYINKK
jgi:hypothetical protein